jgi:hypothetical protein
MTMISEWLREEAPDDNELAELPFITRALRGQVRPPPVADDKSDVPTELIERSAQED